MEMYEINYLIAYGANMTLITWLLMEMYDINYLITYGDVWY